MPDFALKYNSFSVVFVFFLYSLTTLPGMFMNQGALTAALALVSLSPIIIYNVVNNFSISMVRAFFIELCVLLLLCFEMVVYSQYEEAIQEATLYMLTMGTIGFFVGSFQFDDKYCLRYGNVLALLCLITSTIALFRAENMFLFSMRFGYSLLPSALWFLMTSIYKRSFFSLFLFMLSLFLLVVWGSRGTLLVILLFLLLYTIKSRNKYVLVGILVALPLFPYIQDFIVSILTDIADATGAKKIDSLINLLSGAGAEATTGRDSLYEHCIDLIIQNPLGNGVGFWMYDPVMHGLFPHNVFLHVGTEFGDLGLLFIFSVIGVAAIKTLKSNDVRFFFLAYIFSISIGRLLVSSMYWARPEFWLFAGIFLCNRNATKGNRIDSVEVAEFVLTDDENEEVRRIS